MTGGGSRRPIAARAWSPSRWLAARLAAAGVAANAISASSVGFAAAAAAALLWAPAHGAVLWLSSAAFIGLRLLANMLDGMVAVEHGRASATGPIWNELPDRVSDALILVSVGYSLAAMLPGIAGTAIALGWISALGAMLTAYVRELGRALGEAADFSGPFAKQQRMAAVVVGAIASAFDPLWGGSGQVLAVALAVTAAGTLFTVLRRAARLAARLHAADPRD